MQQDKLKKIEIGMVKGTVIIYGHGRSYTSCIFAIQI